MLYMPKLELVLQLWQIKSYTSYILDVKIRPCTLTWTDKILNSTYYR